MSAAGRILKFFEKEQPFICGQASVQFIKTALAKAMYELRQTNKPYWQGRVSALAFALASLRLIDIDAMERIQNIAAKLVKYG